MGRRRHLEGRGGGRGGGKEGTGKAESFWGGGKGPRESERPGVRGTVGNPKETHRAKHGWIDGRDVIWRQEDDECIHDDLRRRSPASQDTGGAGGKAARRPK